jgi:hypothetical protein
MFVSSGYGWGRGGKSSYVKNGRYILCDSKWFSSVIGSDFALEPMNEAGS